MRFIRFNMVIRLKLIYHFCIWYLLKIPDLMAENDKNNTFNNWFCITIYKFIVYEQVFIFENIESVNAEFELNE